MIATVFLLTSLLGMLPSGVIGVGVAGVLSELKRSAGEYTDVFSDEEGTPTPGMPSSHSVVELVEKDGRTKVTTTTSYASEEALSQVLEMGMKEGLTQTLDKLEEVLRVGA